MARLLALAALGACSTLARAEGAPPTFVDVTQARGIDFHHTSPPTGEHRLPEIMGAGVALFDYDGDDRLDLLFAGAPPAGPSLYRQKDDGNFEDTTHAAGLHSEAYGMGVALGDIDNDGDLDVYLTHVGRDQLYRNEGDGTFRDVTAGAGIVGGDWSTSAAFCDIDNDGLLDLYVASYVHADGDQRCTTQAGVPDYCPPNVYPAVADRLLRNRGDGTFDDIGAASGIAATRSPALGVVCWDFDTDGRSDVFVANDGTPNHLWINQGSGRFVDRAIELGVATNLFGESEAGMGIAIGDLNGDRAMDLFITHVDRETNTLYLSGETGVLLDATIPSNLGPVSSPLTGFGAALLDFDLDGDLDLAVANGRVRRPSTNPPSDASFESVYGETNLLLANDGAGRFENACGGSAFCEDRSLGRGLVAADFDRDGDLDLVLSSSNGPGRLYENHTAAGRWLAVRALSGGRDAIGASVELRTSERQLTRPVVHSSSYLSSHEAIVHFGLGTADSILALDVQWPDGHRESFDVPEDLNRTVVVVRGAGAAH